MYKSRLSEETKLRFIGAGFIICWLAFSIGVLALAAYAVAKAVALALVCA